MACKGDEESLIKVCDSSRSILRQIYCDVISKSFDFKNTEFVASVKKFMNIILVSEQELHKRDPFGLNDYQNEACLCAYMLQYFFRYSNTVMRCFIKFLVEDEIHSNELLSKKEIRICCLGGGPGTEAIGIGKAIESMLTKEKLDNNIELYITIIDRCKNWKAVALKSVKDAQKHSDVQFKWNLHFIEEDLSQPLSKQSASRIRKADCLTMVNFSSSILSSKSISEDDQKTVKRVIKNKIEEILSLIRKGALILYLDSEKDRYKKKISNIVSSISTLKVYECIDSFQSYEEIPAAHKIMESLDLRMFEYFFLRAFSPTRVTIWIRASASEIKQKEKKIAFEMRNMKLGITGRFQDKSKNLSSREKEQPTDRPFVPKRIYKGSHLAHFKDKESEKKKKSNKYREDAKKASNSRCLRDDDD